MNQLVATGRVIDGHAIIETYAADFFCNIPRAKVEHGHLRCPNCKGIVDGEYRGVDKCYQCGKLFEVV